MTDPTALPLRRPHAVPVFAVALAGLVLLPWAATSAHAQAQQPPAITVSGEARISAAPDLAEIDGGVTTEAKTAREATQANNTAMGAVVAALRSAGLAEKDVQTSRLSLQPQSSANRSGDGPVRIVGYRATNTVTVRIRDIGEVAAVIDTLTGAGANTISGVSFTVSQASKLLDEARVQALADARRKAEIYAKAAGVALGAPLNISEAPMSGPVPMLRQAKYAADAGASIAPGEETLHVSVAVSYEIKPAKP